MLGALALRSSLLCCAVAVALGGCTRIASSSDHAANASSAPSAAMAAGAPQTLHLYIAQSPTSLNPLLATTADEQILSDLAYDPLLIPDAANHLQPDLAAVVPTIANGGISRDGKTITFKLVHGVRWQDGVPFTSADVAFTFAKINDPKVNVVQRSGYDHIVHVATPDAYTVVVSLREPYAPFVAYVGYQYPIVPKHVLERSADINRDPLGTRPMGTGAWRFTRWERGNKIEYVANSTYFRGAPKIPNLSIAEIPDQNTVAIQTRTHQLDLVSVTSSPYAQLRPLPDVRATTEPTNDFVAYAINTARPPLNDVRVRRAISMAIDRATIAAKNTFGTGTPAYADLPAVLWTTHEPPNPYAYDPAAANALLDAAGWQRGPSGIRIKNGVPLRLNAINFSSKTGESIDVQVAQMLHDVGIACSVKYFSPSQYYQSKADGGPLAAANYDMASLGWNAGTDTQNDLIYTCANREPAGDNAAIYCSPHMDALQRDALGAGALDPARRATDVAKIEALAVTDVPYVFLYHTPWRIVYNPKLVRTHSNINDVWYDSRNWSFNN